MRGRQFGLATLRWQRSTFHGACAATALFVSAGMHGGCSSADAGSSDAGGPQTYAGPEAGAADGGDAYLAASAALFDRSQGFDVALELDPDDWWTIGTEGRGLSAISCNRLDGPSDDFSYTWFTGTATVAGEPLVDVAIRKKGFLGSLSITRPSLKVDFDNFVPRREHHALEKLTLNNNRQDGSRIRQCLSYLLFERAGVPTPRCGFAHVLVNGEDLGTYANVESISKRFLRSRFGSDSGNLFEGQGADFLSAKWGQFDAKTDVTTDTSDLDRLRDALLTDAAARVEAVEQVLDLDAYLTYWTMEALVADWDSYSSTSNNYFLYDDPRTGFQFIPWGADATLNEQSLSGGKRPQSISADSDLSRELWEIPEMRERYAGRMRELLDRVWDEQQLLAEIDRMAALTPDADPDELEQIRSFVRRRRAVITEELDAGPEPLPATKFCFVSGSTVSGSFRGAWGGSSDAVPAAFELSLDGQPVAVTNVSAKGAAVQLMGPPGLGIILAAEQPNGSRVSVQLEVESALFAAGTVPTLGISDVGLVSGLHEATSVAPFQFISDGSITFDEAGSEPGDPISGTFHGRLYRIQL